MNKTNIYQKLLALSAEIPDITDHVLEISEFARDKEWTAIDSHTILVTDYIDNYQVIRYFDSESEYFEDIFDDKGIPEREAIINKYTDRLMQINNEYEEDSSDYYHAREDIELDLSDELEQEFGYSPCFHFQIREFAQIWIDINTCEVYFIGRPWSANNDYIYNPYRPMSVLDPDGELSDWCARILTYMPTHFDFSKVHPVLEQNGYRSISVWTYDTTFDDTPSMYSILDNDAITITDFLIGYINRKKATRLHTLIDILPDYIFHKIQSEEVHNFTEVIVPAIKIARRHRYTAINDRWIQLLDFLTGAQLDTRNPKYICPEDIEATIQFALNRQAVIARYRARQRERLQAEREMKALQQKKKNINAFAKRMAIYSACRLSNSELDIFPAATFNDLVEEGEAMHHCVGSEMYLNKTTAVILFVRDKFGARIATSEVNTNTWTIVQTQGICNSVPQYNGQLYRDEINELIKNFLIPQLSAAYEASIIQTKTITA